MTIERTLFVEDERMYLAIGKEKGSRELFNAAGLKIYCIGPLDGLRYQQATNLCLNLCEEMHIPAISLRRASVTPPAKSIASDTKSTRMKGF